MNKQNKEIREKETKAEANLAEANLAETKTEETKSEETKTEETKTKETKTEEIELEESKVNEKQIEIRTIIAQAESKMEEVDKDPWRLAFHLMPPVGWMNDPNGLCQIRGEYCVFFQYAPAFPENQKKCWGWYTSRDLIHWEYKGVPLIPDRAYDRDGVYSGAALVEDGKVHLFYTGNVKKDGDYDYIHAGRTADTVYVCLNPNKAEQKKTVVIPHSQYPKDCSCHIRDPKVWKEQDQYYLVLGARSTEDTGKILIYHSPDKIHWDLESEISTEEKFGYMWECPDLFTIDGKRCLSYSPQGLERRKYENQNVYQSGYSWVRGNYHTKATVDTFHEWDKGFDFYAPQTFTDEQGRLLMIGWMGLPDIEGEYANPTKGRGWEHALTMIRQLTTDGEKIYQNPVKEYEQLRKEKQTLENGVCCKDLHTFEFQIENPDNESFDFVISDGLVFAYCEEMGQVCLKFLDETGAGRNIRRGRISTCDFVQVFVDTSAIEIYINHGEMVFTSRFYPDAGCNSLQVNGKVCHTNVWKH